MNDLFKKYGELAEQSRNRSERTISIPVADLSAILMAAHDQFDEGRADAIAEMHETARQRAKDQRF